MEELLLVSVLIVVTILLAFIIGMVFFAVSPLVAEMNKINSMSGEIYNRVFTYSVWIFGIALIGLGAVLVVWVLTRIRRSKT